MARDRFLLVEQLQIKRCCKYCLNLRGISKVEATNLCSVESSVAAVAVLVNGFHSMQRVCLHLLVGTHAR